MGLFYLRKPVSVGGGGGSSDYSGVTPNKYVKSAGAGGSNSNNGNSEATAYATIAFAMGQISAGQIVGVVDNISENINIGTLSGGSVGSFKHVVAKTDGTEITGTFSGSSGTPKYIKFEGLHWKHGSSEHDCGGVTQLKFICCGFQGGIASAGNTVTHLAGSNQLYEDCYWITTGGRYASLCFEKSNTLYRRPLCRTDNWGSPADDGNPNAGIQLYSCNSCAIIQGVAVDCQLQRSNNEWLAGLSVTTNTGASSGILHQECFVVRAPGIAIQVEGSNACTYQGLGNISVDSTWGFVENLDSGSGSITITGGEYSSHSQAGIARFGAESFTPTNVNTTGNGGGNFNGVSAGSGCTTNALNMTNIVNGMLARGVDGTMYGETGWNVQQAEELFPMRHENLYKTKLNAVFSARGFTAQAGSTPLTDYLKTIT